MAKIKRTPNRIRKPIEKARKRYDDSMNAVYAAAHPRNDVRFSDCLKLASDTVRSEHEAAQSDLIQQECAAYFAGHMWRDTFGHAQFYE